MFLIFSLLLFSYILTECVEKKFGKEALRFYKDKAVKFFRYKADYRYKKGINDLFHHSNIQF